MSDATPGAVDTTPPPGPRLLRLGDLLAEWQEYAERVRDHRVNGTPLGPVTGLRPLDEALGHTLEPGIHVVLGQSGAGKTAFALQVAASAGCPALYVSCEMAAIELLRRHTARVTGTYLNKFKSGDLAPEVSLSYVKDAVTAAPGLAILDATLAHASPQVIAEAAREIQGDDRYVLVVVDSVHSWTRGAPGQQSEYDKLNAYLDALRNVSDALHAPVMVVAERNRASADKGGLNSGAGSRVIEYGASSVLDLEVKKSEDPSGEKAVELRIEKNRNGAAGRPIKLKFIPSLQKFVEA